MAIIRISHWHSGIERYLETGQKMGRELTRDELDYRKHISGDMDAFSIAVNHTRKTKDWKTHYVHLSVGFSLGDNQKLTDEMLDNINKEILNYYVPTHNIEDILHQSEAHLPKIQSIVNKSTGQLVQRLGHVHIAIAKYDVQTGNQIRIKPYSESADLAFQTYINQKYKLDDPQANLREKSITKKDLLARNKGDLQNIEVLAKQTVVAKTRKQFAEILRNVETLHDAKHLLMQCENVKEVLLFKNKRNTYFKVTKQDGGNINIRGRGFEHIEKMYAGQNASLRRKDKEDEMAYLLSKKAHERTLEENRRVWQESQNWWLEQCEQRKSSKRKKSGAFDYEKVTKRYESAYQKYTKEQRRFFVMYQDNINEHLVSGFNIFDNQSHKFLVNNRKGIKIYDKPNKITMELPQDKEARLDAIRLALRMAEAKGWDINHLQIQGSDEFKKETMQVINEINRLREQKGVAHWKYSDYDDSEPLEAMPERRTALNSASNALDNALDKQEKKRSSIEDLKHKINAQTVLDYVVESYGVDPSWYEVTEDNKLKDTRLDMAPKSTIDFMIKVCNLRFTDAQVALQELLETQQSNTTLDASEGLQDESVQSSPAVKKDMTFVQFLESYDSYTEHDYKKDSDELEKDLEEKKDLEQEDFLQSDFKV